MSVLDTLITDRTNGDVQDRNDKGTYNATDINRVNSAAEYVAQEALDLLQNLQQYLQTMGVADAPIFQPYEADDVSVNLPVIKETAPNLPAGYTELDYIEKEGSPYINTGVIPTGQSRIIMDIVIYQYSDWQAPYGARDTSQSDGPFTNTLFISPDNLPRVDYFGNTISLQNVVPIGERIIIDMNKNTVHIGEQAYTFPNSFSEANYPWFLLDVNTAGQERGSGHFRLYSTEIYQDDTLVRNYIPCLNSASAVGLYDIVNNQFYGNSGPGTFTAGPEADIPIVERTTWEIPDIPYTSQMAQYLANITNLRALLSLPSDTPSVPADMAGLTYQEANAIEQILLSVDSALAAWWANAQQQIDYIGTYANHLVSGTFYSGSNRTLQHFSRGR